MKGKGSSKGSSDHPYNPFLQLFGPIMCWAAWRLLRLDGVAFCAPNEIAVANLVPR